MPPGDPHGPGIVSAFPPAPSHTVRAVLPHTAFPRAVDGQHSALPGRWSTIQAIRDPARSSSSCRRLGSKSLIPADAETPTAHPATGPSLGQVMLSVPIIATTTCADFRCALGRFVGCTYRPRLLPGAAGRQNLRPPDAGAQTDLSSCVLGWANVPIPLRRTVPRGSNSKVFTPSMAFAQSERARLRLFSAARRRDL